MRDDRALRLSDLRFVLRHVHRQFHELPDRGARPRAAGQRHACSRRMPTAGRLFVEAGHLIVDLCAALLRAGRPVSVLPRGIATLRGIRERHDARYRHGRLDQHGAASAGRRAGGGSAVHAWRDIDRLSRRVPVLCKVAPSLADVHLEDVHRAGGIMAILGELDRAGLIASRRAHRPCGDASARRSTPGTCAASTRRERRRASIARRPAACRRTTPSARSARFDAISISTARTAASATSTHAFSQGRRPRGALRQPRDRKAAS